MGQTCAGALVDQQTLASTASLVNGSVLTFNAGEPSDDSSPSRFLTFATPLETPS